MSALPSIADIRRYVGCPKSAKRTWHEKLLGDTRSLLRSRIRWRRAEPIRSRRACQEAELDQEPDRADDRYQGDQHPPPRLVSIMPAFDVDEDGGDEGDERKQAAQNATSGVGVIGSYDPVDEGQH
jgi:hypothetical protein